MLAKILIASLLKSVDDVRSFERFALSLVPDFQVFIIGSPSNFLPNLFEKITFIPLPFFPRTFFQRIQGVYFFAQKLFDLKPDILIIQSPDLLVVSVFYKLFFGKKLIYDIQENYFNNIFYQNYYTNWKKYLLAFGVRLLERLCSLFVDGFFLAEKSYEKELCFVEKKFFLVENKYALVKYGEHFCSPKSKEKLHFIYTGTVSAVYGTHRTIEFIKKLYAENQELRLTLIGCCLDQNYWDKLNKMVEGCSYIDWKISQEPVNHGLIMEEIQKANFGILGYLPNRSTENCVPSKIYEYMAYRLPILMPSNPFWESITAPYKASFRIDFEDFNPPKYLDEIQNFLFYETEPIPETVWKFDREGFKKIVLSLYSQSNPFK